MLTEPCRYTIQNTTSTLVCKCYCIRGYFRSGFIFANFASQSSRKCLLHYVAIYSNENITKIAKLRAVTHERKLELESSLQWWLQFVFRIIGPYTREKICNLNDHCNDDCNASLEFRMRILERRNEFVYINTRVHKYKGHVSSAAQKMIWMFLQYLYAVSVSVYLYAVFTPSIKVLLWNCLL